MTQPDRSYVLISPCRNEADYMRRTLDSVSAQTLRPALWLIVDDGSTDATPEILADYAARHDWIRIVTKPDRGHRAVGPGVIEAFYFGVEQIDLAAYAYSCKLDLDLELPPRYFEILIERMEENSRLGTCSGKPYIRQDGTLVSERRGDDMHHRAESDADHRRQARHTALIDAACHDVQDGRARQQQERQRGEEKHRQRRGVRHDVRVPLRAEPSRAATEARMGPSHRSGPTCVERPILGLSLRLRPFRAEDKRSGVSRDVTWRMRGRGTAVVV